MKQIGIPTKYHAAVSERLDRLHKAIEEFFSVKREDYLSTRKIDKVLIRNIGIYTGVTVAKIDKYAVMASFGKDRSMYYHVINAIDDWFSAEVYYAEELQTLRSFVEFYTLRLSLEGVDLFNVNKMEIVGNGETFFSSEVSGLRITFHNKNSVMRIKIK
jgi:hypothetical protein